jgi:Cof subfamily protein (haloacid dehalogenase superfamily)
MIKLISLDIDGTLLDNQGELPAANLKAIRSARERGIHIILNSGKPFSAISNLVNDLGIDDPVISLTGGLIYAKDTHGDWLVLDSYPLPEASFAEIHQIVNSLPLSIFFFTRQTSYIYHLKKDQSYLQRFDELLMRNTVPEYTLLVKSPLLDCKHLDLPVYKIMFYSDIEKEIWAVYDALNQLRYPGLVVEGSSRDTVDIHLAQTGKRQAIQSICNRFQIDRSEVMALGDHESDYDLIQWAGVGAVMANAKLFLKTDAPLIAPSNEEGGVAIMIQKYALKG